MIESRNKERAEPETGQPDISLEVLKRRCLLKDQEGNIIETPQQMYMRVAKTIAEVESGYGVAQQMIQLLCEIFYKLMAGGKFLPNSPTLMNAGQEEGLLSACFVLPVNDSIIEIFEAVRNTALIQKAGGGTGFAFDRLRPTGDIVASSGGKRTVRFVISVVTATVGEYVILDIVGPRSNFFLWASFKTNGQQGRFPGR